jgi:drug/metabolite transporter (DMT)-like permease
VTARTARSLPAGGVLLAVLSAASFGTSGVFGSALIGAGWSPAAAVLARITVAAALLTMPALVQLRGQWALLRRGAGRAAAFGLVAVAGCQVCYFNAITRIPVGVALLLEYLGAVLVVVWLWLRHHQRPRRLTLAGVAAAVVGLVLVLDLTGPAGSGRLDPIGVLWAALAAVGLATYFMLSSARQDQLPPLVMTWAGMWVGGVVIAATGLAGVLPMRASAGDVGLGGHQVSWVLPIAGLSLIAAALAYTAGISAVRRLGAKLGSFIGMSEVLFAIGFAWLLLGQQPTPTQFVGGAFILAGVTLVRLDEQPASVPGGRAARRAPSTPAGHGASAPREPAEAGAHIVGR